MTVPEAPPDVDHFPQADEYQVGRSRQVRSVQAKPIPEAMNGLSHD